MLPDVLKDHDVATVLEARLPDAITGGGREREETLLWVRPERIVEVCTLLRDAFQFVRISGVTAIDRCPLEPRFEVLYLLHSLARNERIKLKVALPGDAAVVDSVTPVWPGADWYERETFDMFGVVFRNHPNLKRILMPDYWEGHPLRRDFPTHGYKYSYQDE